MSNSQNFFKDKPLFGLDIGSSSIKVMQLEKKASGNNWSVVGYGVTAYDKGAIDNGVIVDYELLAKPVFELLKKGLVGEINTRRVALSIPATYTFTRLVTLPKLKDNQIVEAIRLEAEQYIPVPIDDLYLDHEIINETADGMELLVVGVPRSIVDSYMTYSRILGLEPVLFDTTILATGRLFQRQSDIESIATVLIDFGATSADITVFDKSAIVTGTTKCGGSQFTDLIATKLGISQQEAHIVKSKYGISKSKRQTEILDVLEPQLSLLLKEIRRMIRYHDERSDSKRKIEQVITMGGGANMPGLSDYLTNNLRLPVRTCNPWQNLDTGKLQPPTTAEKSLYVTAAGLAHANPKELFK